MDALLSRELYKSINKIGAFFDSGNELNIKDNLHITGS